MHSHFDVLVQIRKDLHKNWIFKIPVKQPMAAKIHFRVIAKTMFSYV